LPVPIREFHRGMRHAGFVKNRNVKLIDRWAKHDLGQLPDLARQLVEKGIDVLVATGGIAAAEAAVNAVKSAGAQIPIVLVASFDADKPELDLSGNVTAVNTLTTHSLPKRLKLAKELLGESKVIALLVNGPGGKKEREKLPDIPVLEARTKDELKAAFTKAKKEGYAVLVGADPFFTANQKLVVELAKKNNVPAIYPWRLYVDGNKGGLISHGPNLAHAYRQAGVFVGRVLDDTKHGKAHLEPLTLELVINLKAAKTHDLKIPHHVLARAHHIVE
jgi:ABC-type uncharacterized transport system substrate-binding protein